MAKLIYGMITSLDGYAVATDGDLGTGAEVEEVHTFIGETFRPVRTFLYGRRMYETMVFWETAHADPDAPFFGLPENAAYRTDAVAWLRQLFDLSCEEYDRLDLDRDDPVRAMADEFAVGLDGLGEREVRARLTRIERLVGERVQGRKLYGPLADELLHLKYLHQRYTNYLAWLRGGGR